MNRDHNDTVERCKSIIISSIPKPATNKNRTTGGAQTAPLNNCFKPQSDLKPAHLARDCTLPEFITFTKTFIICMNSAGTPIPKEAVYSILRVYMDPWWYTDLGHKGLDINTDLSKFPKIMDIALREHFPIHSRRMRVFRTEQKGDSMSFLREIIDNMKLADWNTFCEETNLLFSTTANCWVSSTETYTLSCPKTQEIAFLILLSNICSFFHLETWLIPSSVSFW